MDSLNADTRLLLSSVPSLPLERRALRKRCEVAAITSENLGADGGFLGDLNSRWLEIGSTYPNGVGNPIADCATVSHRGSSAWLCLGDGCHWGALPRRAALGATKAASEVIRESIVKARSTSDVSKVLLEAIHEAHRTIVDGRPDPGDVYSAGTATISVGVAVRLEHPETRWAAMCCSVGRSQVFVVHLDNGHGFKAAEELAPFQSSHVYGMADVGGRIGPILENGTPDLRSLRLDCALACEGDCVLGITDGIASNLEAKSLGLTPEQAARECSYSRMTQLPTSWEDQKHEVLSDLGRTFAQHRLDMVLRGSDCTPRGMCSALVRAGK